MHLMYLYNFLKMEPATFESLFLELNFFTGLKEIPFNYKNIFVDNLLENA